MERDGGAKFFVGLGTFTGVFALPAELYPRDHEPLDFTGFLCYSTVVF